MRLSCMVDNQSEREKMKDFTEWILNIGDGKKASDDGDEMIQIPDDLLLHKGNDTKEVIVQSTYPDLISNYRE
jgi:ATP-dependent DNA helicase PIF1